MVILIVIFQLHLNYAYGRMKMHSYWGGFDEGRKTDDLPNLHIGSF